MNSTRSDHERDHRKDINDPPQTVARDRPALPTRDVPLVDPVGYQSDRQGERHPTDEPRVSPRDRIASPSYRLGAWLGFGGRRARALEREERVDVRRRVTEAPYAKRCDEDEQLHSGGREVGHDGLDWLRSESEGGDRTLDQEEHRETDARLQAPLASTRDHDRHDR